MVGLLFFGAVALYALAWFFVVRAVNSRFTKVVLIAIAIAIPFWDTPFGYLQFTRACKMEGGARLTGNLPPLSGILLTSNSGYTADYLYRFGFPIVEVEQKDVFARYTALGNGFERSIQKSPVSNIRVHQTRDLKHGLNVRRSDISAELIPTGQPIAQHSEFRWYITWWQAALAPLLGYGAYCHAGGDELFQLLRKGKAS